MSDRNRNTMNDAELDALLTEELSALPPSDGLVTEITPWRRATNRILVGLALTCITLNFFWLDYLLPTIGVLLMFLGFRVLRWENRWLGLCWLLSLLRLIWQLATMVLNTTIWNQTFYQYFSIPLTIVVWAVTLTGIFCLWRGLLAIQRRAGLEPHAGGAVALLVWYLILIGLGLIQYSGLLFGIPVVIVYFFIIRSLYRLSSELDEAGYTVQAAPVRLSDRTVQCICVGILLVGGLTGYLRFSSYPMDWTPSNPQAEQAGLEDIRTHLLELGFPEKVLDDLSAEDLAACQGALQVIVDETDEPVNAGRSVTRRQGNHYTQTTEYDIKELHITGIAVQLPGERHHWKLFHHFSWTVNPGFYGTEAIQLWPTTRNQWWRVQGNFSGQILYDQDGVCYCSPYHSMGNFTYQKNTLFWGDQTSNDYFLTFSFPRQGERQRGYVSYEILAMQEGYIIDSWFNYVHQSSWAQYPVQTAMEHRISYSPFSRQSTFFTVQDALQFYPYEEDPQPFS